MPKVDSLSFRLLVWPLVGLWFWALIGAFSWQIQEQGYRLRATPHIVETITFYIQHQNPRAIPEVLKTLRLSVGLTSLQLCHRGRVLWKDGEIKRPCSLAGADEFAGEHWRSPLGGGYELYGEARLMTSWPSLILLLLVLSFMIGCAFFIQVWHLRQKAPQNVERSA